MITDFPMFTLSLSICWCDLGSLDAGAAEAGGAAGAGAGAWGVAGLTDSSRFHIVEILPLRWNSCLRVR
jgi:hypothetical protein